MLGGNLGSLLYGDVSVMGNKGTEQTAQICRLVSAFAFCMGTVMTLSFRKDRFRQTAQTQIRLLLEEQLDQGLHCLLFHLHL